MGAWGAAGPEEEGKELGTNNAQVAVLSLRGRESGTPSSGPRCQQAACASPWRREPGDEKADRCARCGSSCCPDGTGTRPEGFGTGNCVSGKRVPGSPDRGDGRATVFHTRCVQNSYPGEAPAGFCGGAAAVEKQGLVSGQLTAQRAWLGRLVAGGLAPASLSPLRTPQGLEHGRFWCRRRLCMFFF